MPYYESETDSESDESDRSVEEKTSQKLKQKPYKVEIDLSLSAYANAEKYYSKKRLAKNKEQRTIDASEKVNDLFFCFKFCSLASGLPSIP